MTYGIIKSIKNTFTLKNVKTFLVIAIIILGFGLPLILFVGLTYSLVTENIILMFPFTFIIAILETVWILFWVKILYKMDVVK